MKVLFRIAEKRSGVLLANVHWQGGCIGIWIMGNKRSWSCRCKCAFYFASISYPTFWVEMFINLSFAPSYLFLYTKRQEPCLTSFTSVVAPFCSLSTALPSFCLSLKTIPKHNFI